MRFKWEYPSGSSREDQKKQSIFQRLKNQRGYSTDFLEADFDQLPDINRLKDIDKAADRIIRALSDKEKIMIYGHDDLDGITATYILFDYLEQVGYQNHYYYIPNRKTDNHGIQQNLIKRLIKEDFNLLITVDGGISDFDAIDEINEAGIDVIITDHHMVQGRIPKAFAVVNPKQNDCSYPYKMIAGVAVSYFLVKKIEEKLLIPTKESYIFWVAMGSISDKVSLTGVNRTIIRKALDKWLLFNDLNLKVLYNYLKPARNASQKMIASKNLIKLFSNGRLADGENKTLSFLLSSEDGKSIILQDLLDNLQSQDEVVKKALDFFSSLKFEPDDFYYFYYDRDNKIPQEVIGLVASQIVYQHKIPALILKNKNDVVGCEARSTDGLNLVDSFKLCQDYLIQYGGHAKAAGFTCEPALVAQFEHAFAKVASAKKELIDQHRILNIDVVLECDQLPELIDFLETEYHFLQPFGEGNISPIFLIKNYDLKRNPLNIHGYNYDKIEDFEKADVVVKNNGNGFNLIDMNYRQER